MYSSFNTFYDEFIPSVIGKYKKIETGKSNDGANSIEINASATNTSMAWPSFIRFPLF
ncbi:MAG: hypothetical protein WA631_11130 [Nitrososphaeraceae archaeon]